MLKILKKHIFCILIILSDGAKANLLQVLKICERSFEMNLEKQFHKDMVGVYEKAKMNAVDKRSIKTLFAESMEDKALD